MATRTLTAQEERFAQAVASGLNQSDAYRQAYNCPNSSPETIWQNASHLAAKVAPRIAVLRDHDAQVLAQKRAWDKERFIDEAESNLSQSRELNQMAPANGALAMIGKATGIIQDQLVTPETALGAIIKMAQALTEAQLRGLAAGKTVEAESWHLGTSEEEQGP